MRSKGLLELVQFQGAVFHVEVDPGHLAATVLGNQQPGRDIGIVVEAGEDDLVARVEGVRQGPADVQGQGGHVVAEDDLLGAGGVQEVGHGAMGLRQDSVRLNAGGKSAFVVGVAFHQIALDAPGGLPGDLGSARVIKEDGRAVERGELCADDIQVCAKQEVKYSAVIWTPRIDYIFTCVPSHREHLAMRVIKRRRAQPLQQRMLWVYD